MIERPVTSLRSIALPAYLPTTISATGLGAVLPVLALSARERGAGLGLAAFVVALVGVGQLAGDLPAGAFAARVGEKRALLVACALEASAMLGCWLAPSLAALLVAVLGLGVSGALWGLARQAYLTEAVVLPMRARALATLGGTHRIGLFLGPFLGAAVVVAWGIDAAYLVGVAASSLALLPLLALPDLPGVAARGGGEPAAEAAVVPVLSVLRAHRRVFATLGVGVVFVCAARAARTAVVPLWGEAIGLDAARTSLVFGIAGAVDMLLFYPGGYVMDRWGRVHVAVPSMIVLGGGLLLLPLAGSFAGLLVVAMVLGLGNGIGSGIVMTLGSDASPQLGRAQFIGGWRVMADVGTSLGPVVVGVLAAVLSLGAASVAMGVLTLLGAGWLRVWAPRYDPRLRGPTAGTVAEAVSPGPPGGA